MFIQRCEEAYIGAALYISYPFMVKIRTSWVMEKTQSRFQTFKVLLTDLHTIDQEDFGFVTYLKAPKL